MSRHTRALSPAQAELARSRPLPLPAALPCVQRFFVHAWPAACPYSNRPAMVYR